MQLFPTWSYSQRNCPHLWKLIFLVLRTARLIQCQLNTPVNIPSSSSSSSSIINVFPSFSHRSEDETVLDEQAMYEYHNSLRKAKEMNDFDDFDDEDSEDENIDLEPIDPPVVAQLETASTTSTTTTTTTSTTTTMRTTAVTRLKMMTTTSATLTTTTLVRLGTTRRTVTLDEENQVIESKTNNGSTEFLASSALSTSFQQSLCLYLLFSFVSLCRLFHV